MKIHLCLVPCLVLLGWLCSAQTGSAAGDVGRRLTADASLEITSSNARDFKELVESAEDGSVIEISAETLELTSRVTISTAITLQGQSVGQKGVIKCLNYEAGLDIRSDGVKLSNLEISGCGGAVRIIQPDEDGFACIGRTLVPSMEVEIDHVDFLDNFLEEPTFENINCLPVAAALGVGTGSIVTVNECLFEGNIGSKGAGMLVQLGSAVTITDSKFKKNVAKSIGGGGGLFAGTSYVRAGNQSSLVMEGCTFEGNICETGREDDRGYQVDDGTDLEAIQVIKFLAPSAAGGAIHVDSFDEVKVDFCKFDGNLANPAGGAIFLTDVGSVDVLNSTFTDNHAIHYVEGKRVPLIELGGALYALFFHPTGTIRVEDCHFEGNSAGFGGGIHFVAPIRPDASPSFKNCTFTRNKATHGGGGFTIRNARKMDLYALAMFENEAEIGGGLFVTNGGGGHFTTSYIYSNTVFADNIAVNGGGIFTFGAGDFDIISALTSPIRFFRNRAINNGGAMAFVESAGISSVKLQGVAVENNVARRGGGVYVDAVASFRMISEGSIDPALKFTGNTAQAGGGVYIRMSGLIQNEVSFSLANFTKNMAVANISPFLDYMVFNKENRRGNLFTKVVEKNKDGDSLINPLAAEPCSPGGGGAICFVGGRIPITASAKFELIKNVFTGNKGQVGGALLISTQEGTDWNEECSDSENLCRALTIKQAKFVGNNATGAGGAIFATYPKHINFLVGEGKAAPLDTGNFEAAFTNNKVGKLGYGPDIATSAVSLMLKKPLPDSEGLIARDQLSGKALVEMMLNVKDYFNQTVTNGIKDAELSIQVKSSPLSGQLVSKAVAGEVIFQALHVLALPGQYPLALIGKGVSNVTVEYSIRACMIGEFNITDSLICRNCTKDFFSVKPEMECDKCSSDANCTGGPVIVPHDGFWHSTPHSPFIHTCLLPSACSYVGRNAALEQYFTNRSTLHPNGTMLPNDVYPLCGKGHMGVLCGQCSEDYGHIGGGTCVHCGNERWKNILTVLGVGLWTLILTLFTLKSAMTSIRDINEVLLMQAAIKEASSRQLAREQTGAGANASQGTAVGASRECFPAPVEQEGLEIVDKSGKWDNIMLEAPLDATVTGNSEKPLVTVDHIVAADNLSETVKIVTNFLQIVSVAISINTNWTEEVLSMLKIQDVISGFSGGASIMPLDCIFTAGIKLRSALAVVLRIFFPFIIMFIIMVLAYGVFAYYVKKGNPPSLSFDRYLIIIAIVSLFFAYESVTGDLMRILNCVAVDELYEDTSLADYSEYFGAVGLYWGEDTVHKCYQGGHRILVWVLGIPGLIFFTVGIPAGLLVFFLWKKSHGLHKEQKFINTYGFLFQNYDEKFVYWEVAIMSRKALIGAIVVYAYPLGSNLQGVLAQGVLVVALVLQLIAAPYKYRALNLLESASLVVSIFVYYAGILFNDGKTSTQVRTLVNIIILMANCGFMILFLWKVVHLVDRIVVARLQNFGVPVPSNYFRRMQRLAEVYMLKAKEATEKLASRARATHRLMSKKRRNVEPKQLEMSLPEVREV